MDCSSSSRYQEVHDRIRELEFNKRQLSQRLRGIGHQRRPLPTSTSTAATISRSSCSSSRSSSSSSSNEDEDGVCTSTKHTRRSRWGGEDENDPSSTPCLQIPDHVDVDMQNTPTTVDTTQASPLLPMAKMPSTVMWDADDYSVDSTQAGRERKTVRYTQHLESENRRLQRRVLELEQANVDAHRSFEIERTRLHDHLSALMHTLTTLHSSKERHLWKEEDTGVAQRDAIKHYEEITRWMEQALEQARGNERQLREALHEERQARSALDFFVRHQARGIDLLFHRCSCLIAGALSLDAITVTSDPPTRAERGGARYGMVPPPSGILAQQKPSLTGILSPMD